MCMNKQVQCVSKAVNILFLQLLKCYSLALVTLDLVRVVKAINGIQEITLFQKILHHLLKSH